MSNNQESWGVDTSFGKFTNTEAINLRLARDRLIDKPMLSFHPKMSKFDFGLLLDQFINTGIHIHWYISKLSDDSGYGGWHHLIITEEPDINLIKIICDKVTVLSSNQLFDELL